MAHHNWLLPVFSSWAFPAIRKLSISGVPPPLEYFRSITHLSLGRVEEVVAVVLRNSATGLPQLASLTHLDLDKFELHHVFWDVEWEPLDGIITPIELPGVIHLSFTNSSGLKLPFSFFPFISKLRLPRIRELRMGLPRAFRASAVEGPGSFIYKHLGTMMATSTIESFSLSVIFVEDQHVGTPIVEICQYTFTPNPPSLIIKYDSATDYETEELDLVPIRPSVQMLRILDVNGKGQKIATRPS